MYKLKKLLTILLPKRADHLHHWIWISYIALFLGFFSGFELWVDAIIVMVIAALVEGLDYLSNKGTPEWSDFIITTLAGWIILTILFINQLINIS